MTVKKQLIFLNNSTGYRLIKTVSVDVQLVKYSVHRKDLRERIEDKDYIEICDHQNRVPEG